MRHGLRQGIAPASYVGDWFPGFGDYPERMSVVVSDLLCDRESYERHAARLRERAERMWLANKIENEIIGELGDPECDEDWERIDRLVDERIARASA